MRTRIHPAATAALVLATGLLHAAAAGAATLDTHTVRLDGSGRIVPWTLDPADGYDHVIGLSWGLLKSRIPIDPGNGLPVTYTHCEYDPVGLSGSGWPNNPVAPYSPAASSGHRRRPRRALTSARMACPAATRSFRTSP